MRNEGQFILEWVAYFRTLGFDEILVMSNDCDDGSDKMLDRLEKMGELTHIDNTELDDLPPLARGIKRAFAHPVVKSCDWLLLCDADEMPNIDYGDGKIHDLIAAMPGHTDCIALHWRAFGAAGLAEFPPHGNVIEANPLAQADPDTAGFHKSIFRPNKFADAIDHMPKKPHGPVVIRNADGAIMNPIPMQKEWAKYRGTPPELFNFKGASMCHFAIRADDVFIMKNHRGDGRFVKHTKYFKNSGFYNRFNRNDAPESKMQRHLPEVKRRKSTYLQDVRLAELHNDAVAHFQDLKAQVVTSEQIKKWTKKD
jgi:hypothetical protein